MIIYYILFVLQMKSNRYIHEFKKNYSHTWSMRDEKIHFVKCGGLWIELCKIWFDNFAFKKWSRARHMVDSDQKLVRNLDRNKIWLIWICKWCKITLLKVRDEKCYFVKCEGLFEWFSYNSTKGIFQELHALHFVIKLRH